MTELPAYLQDDQLRAELESQFPGTRRIAEARLLMPADERLVRDQAAHIFCHTTPGWRQSDAHFHVARLPFAAAQAIVDRESARRSREHELNQANPFSRVLVDFDGTVRTAASALAPFNAATGAQLVVDTLQANRDAVARGEFTNEWRS
jgi:hypothetical protein